MKSLIALVGGTNRFPQWQGNLRIFCPSLLRSSYVCQDDTGFVGFEREISFLMASATIPMPIATNDANHVIITGIATTPTPGLT
jgi:hypothetical protein